MILRAAALGLLLFSIGAHAAVDPNATRALHALFDSDFQRQLAEDPFSASYFGDDRFNNRLPDLSPKALSAKQQAVRDSRNTLLAISRATLTEPDQLNYDIYLRQLDERITGFRFHDE